MTGLYDDPPIYDLLFTPGTAAEVTGLERIARRWLRSHGQPTARSHAGEPGARSWLEPACGTGRYLRVLAARGHRVAGFDRDPEMVAYARARLRRLDLVRSARVILADLTRFAPRLGRQHFDIAFNLFNTIRHLESDAAVLAHLREVAHVLRPGGVYAVGLSLTRYGSDPPEEDLWEARRGRCAVRQMVQYLPPGTWPPGAMRPSVAQRHRQAARAGRDRTELVVSHLEIERPSGTERRDATYTLRCYDPLQWRRLVARSPFRHLATVNASGDPIAPGAMPYAIHLLER